MNFSLCKNMAGSYMAIVVRSLSLMGMALALIRVIDTNPLRVS